MASYLALIAEATNALSGVLIISCLLLVTVLILRHQHGDSSSVVRVQHQPVQVAVQKLFVPYTLHLAPRRQEAPPSPGGRAQLRVRVQCGASGRGCLVRWWWGVQRQALAVLLHSTWQHFSSCVIDDRAFHGLSGQSKVLEEGDHELELGTTEDLQLGPLPRERYPLVVVQLDTQRHHCNSELGSVVTVLHVSDAECPEPCRVLYQYLKQCTGQLTMLTTLYTQSNGVNPASAGASETSSADVQSSSTTQPPSQPSPTSAKDSEYSEAACGEQTLSDREPCKLQEACERDCTNAVASASVVATSTEFGGESGFEDQNEVVAVGAASPENVTNVNCSSKISNTKSKSVALNLNERPVELRDNLCASLTGSENLDSKNILYSTDVNDGCVRRRPCPAVCGSTASTSTLSSRDPSLSLVQSRPRESFAENCGDSSLVKSISSASTPHAIAEGNEPRSHSSASHDESHRPCLQSNEESPATLNSEPIQIGTASELEETFPASGDHSPAVHGTKLETLHLDPGSEHSSDECVVCQVEVVSVALLPCCHVCVCMQCFRHLMAERQTCPLCRQHVTAYFLV